MSLIQGQILQNRYRITGQLGQGGMGAVYRAWDINLNMPVAVKENLDATPEAQRQFSREAGILARLSHPNLARVIDYFFISDQGQYLVMDFVEGEDLQERLERLGPLPEAEVLLWIGQICDALTYLHRQPAPIIHRDIKPANIKIRPNGQAVLVDFGIAKVYDPNLSTTKGAKAVTPGYSPPEQYGGGDTRDVSDIYALGATLYTLLTGQLPPESVQRMVKGITLPPPRQVNPQVSPRVEQAIVRAMDIATDRRFQSAEELWLALGEVVRPGGFAKPARFGGWIGLGMAVLVLLTIGGVAIGFMEGIGATPIAILSTTSTSEVTSTPLPSATLTSTPVPTETPILRVPSPSATTIPPQKPVPPVKTPTPPISTPTSTPSSTLTHTPTNAPSPTNTALPATNTATFTPIPIAIDTPETSRTNDFDNSNNSNIFPDLDWITIPGGSFIMGSSEINIQEAVADCNAYEGNCQVDWFRAEGPQRTEIVTDFEITRYEITNAQFNLCVENGPCSPPQKTSSDNSVTYDPIFFTANYPVVTIRASDASVFCQWVGGRLPSEREWEKAARGTDGRRYPWGNRLDLSRANLYALVGTTYVGNYPNGASPYGVLDMAGNVAEFTSDNVVRGGSWKSYPHHGCTTNRSTGTWLTYDFVNFDIGFRCVR